MFRYSDSVWHGQCGRRHMLGLHLKPVQAYAAGLKILKAKQTNTISPYCAVGCDISVHTKKSGRLLNTEGDPDHPINAGALCAKGAGRYQMTVNKNRMQTPLYRAPGSDEAIEKIAAEAKATRNASFSEKNAEGQVVNRTTVIAHVSSAALDSEECWLLQGLLPVLGLAYIEHQARDTARLLRLWQSRSDAVR